MSNCIACGGEARNVLLATAENPRGGLFTEEVFACGDCLIRKVVRQALTLRVGDYNWKLGEPSDPTECPTCHRTIHPERLVSCGESGCGMAGCGSCTGVHYDIGACSLCIDLEHWAAHCDADALHSTHFTTPSGLLVLNVIHAEYVAQRVDERLAALKKSVRGE